MGRMLDLLAVTLLLSGALAFMLGMRSLTQEQDRFALYWLCVGALALRAATDLLRPRGAR
jgi:hypothetical protein